ncbi:GGDEF domain-containing protein [Shewanella sp. Scap07]|uniref:GGDEF domain-containing protein n=1 Tax=Shewanella sp. Scap07 TaxID=2589987 RepID=UPI0015C0AA27|nr:GGDEF domain-containing protein [Shewanella sp. Scap07]QLE86211.1 GGDEF domain-containing protein [Shewanella sp. Scap07]
MLPRFANQLMALLVAALFSGLLILSTSTNTSPHTIELSSEIVRSLICAILMFYIERTKAQTFIYLPLLFGFILLFYGTWLNALDDLLMIEHRSIDLTEDMLITLGLILTLLGIINWTQHYQQQISKLEQQSQQDPLTQALNRQGILKKLANAEQQQRPLTIMVMSIDHFKQITRSYGYALGDKLVCLIYQELQALQPDNSDIGRWSDDEFLLLYPLTDKQHVTKLAQHIAQHMESSVFTPANTLISVTVCIGAATGQHLAVEDNIKLVENALYHAQQSGHNQISII